MAAPQKGPLRDAKTPFRLRRTESSKARSLGEAARSWPSLFIGLSVYFQDAVPFTWPPHGRSGLSLSYIMVQCHLGVRRCQAPLGCARRCRSRLSYIALPSAYAKAYLAAQRHEEGAHGILHLWTSRSSLKGHILLLASLLEAI